MLERENQVSKVASGSGLKKLSLAAIGVCFAGADQDFGTVGRDDRTAWEQYTLLEARGNISRERGREIEKP